MATYTMDGRVVPDSARLQRIERLAHLMDDSISIPGTDLKVGLEAIVGLIPGLGDLATAVVSLHIIAEAKKLGVPKKILSKMLWNVAVDTVIGAVPAAGDVFDAFWKANRKNIDLIKKHFENER
ncbi:MAG: DUF4112 domain-containing protein [Burkholderiales bacterium]